jgi:hypothetical protein
VLNSPLPFVDFNERYFYVLAPYFNTCLTKNSRFSAVTGFVKSFNTVLTKKAHLKHRKTKYPLIGTVNFCKSACNRAFWKESIKCGKYHRPIMHPH